MTDIVVNVTEPNGVIVVEVPAAQGVQGFQGEQGEQGASAYEIAVANGFVGDEAAWLASLVGAQGEQGYSAVDTYAVVDMAGGNLTLDASYATTKTIVVLNAPASGTGVLTITATAESPTQRIIAMSGDYNAVLAFSTGEQSADNLLFANTQNTVVFMAGIGFHISRLSITSNAEAFNHKQALSSHGGYNIAQGAEDYTDAALVSPLARITQTEDDIADLKDGIYTTDKLKVVDMTGGNVTINAADSAAYNTILVSNTGDGTEAIRVLTLTEGANNPAQLTIINTGTQPIRVTTGSGIEQSVFKRAVLVYQHGRGFRYVDDHSVIVSATPFGVQKSASATKQLIGSFQLPRGSLKTNGDTVEVDLFLTKGGIASSETIYFDIGTTRATNTTQIITFGALASGNDNLYGKMTFARMSATTIRLVSTPSWHVPQGASTVENADITVPSLDSNDLFFNLSAGVGNETVDCRRLLARLHRG